MFKIIHVLALFALASAGGASVALHEDGVLQTNEEVNLSPSLQIQGNVRQEGNQSADFDSNFVSAKNNIQEDSSIEADLEADVDHTKAEISSDNQNNIDESSEMSVQEQSQGEADVEIGAGLEVDTKVNSQVENSVFIESENIIQI